jgi:type I restriction enzyme S subunit
MWFSTKDKTIYKISKGSLLVVEGGAGAGGAAVAEQDYNDCYAQNSILIVNGANITYNKWLYYILFSIVNNGYIDVVCNKATIPHFTKDKLKNVPVVCFPEEEMEKIIQELDFRCSVIDKTISERKKMIIKYTELKKSLIYEVVTGKIEV